MTSEINEDTDIQMNLPVLDNKFILERTLGSGFSCKVKLGRDAEGKHYAVKIFFSDEHNECANVEIEALSILSHKNIVKIYAAQQGIIKQAGKDEKKVNYIVLELVSGGELFDFVCLGGKLPEATARFYFQQLISGLAYMHQKGVTHRDLKPENLMIDKNFNLKIADFGFAAPIAGRDGSGYLKSNLGTASYKAPELHLGLKYTGEGNDLFAAAVILFTMVSQRPPFGTAHPKDDQLYQLLATEKASVFWQVHAKGNGGKDIYSSEFKDLFEKMTILKPSKRLTMQQVIEHPWLHGELTHQQDIIQDFMRRKEIVDDEAQKNREEKKAQRSAQKKSRPSNIRRSNTKKADEDGDEDDQEEPWMQNMVKPYGTFYPKKTQFFTTADAFEMFQGLISQLKEHEIVPEISGSNLKLKFEVSQIVDKGDNDQKSAAAMQDQEEQKKLDIICSIEVLEVEKDAKYCVDFTYRDTQKRDMPYDEIRKHYKQLSQDLNQFNDTTFDE